MKPIQKAFLLSSIAMLTFVGKPGFSQKQVSADNENPKNKKEISVNDTIPDEVLSLDTDQKRIHFDLSQELDQPTGKNWAIYDYKRNHVYFYENDKLIHSNTPTGIDRDLMQKSATRLQLGTIAIYDKDDAFSKEFKDMAVQSQKAMKKDSLLRAFVKVTEKNTDLLNALADSEAEPRYAVFLQMSTANAAYQKTAAPLPPEIKPVQQKTEVVLGGKHRFHVEDVTQAPKELMTINTGFEGGYAIIDLSKEFDQEPGTTMARHYFEQEVVEFYNKFGAYHISTTSGAPAEDVDRLARKIATGQGSMVDDKGDLTKEMEELFKKAELNFKSDTLLQAYRKVWQSPGLLEFVVEARAGLDQYVAQADETRVAEIDYTNKNVTFFYKGQNPTPYTVDLRNKTMYLSEYDDFHGTFKIKKFNDGGTRGSRMNDDPLYDVYEIDALSAFEIGEIDGTIKEDLKPSSFKKYMPKEYK